MKSSSQTGSEHKAEYLVGFQCAWFSWTKSTHFFLVFLFLRIFCSIKVYQMKSITFLLIWLVVTPKNNRGIRHFCCASCWSQRSQEKSGNDVTKCAQSRPNLIVFLLVIFQMGVFFCLLWKLTQNQAFNQMKKFLRNLAQCDIKIYSGPKHFLGL